MTTFSPADLNPSFYSQFSNNSNDSFAWKMDAILESAYGSKLEDVPQGDFKAKVLSGYRTGESTGTGTDKYDVRVRSIRKGISFLEVKVRPMGIGTGKMLPDPTDPSLTPEQRQQLIGMHEWARSADPMDAALAGTLNCGDEIICYYENGSVSKSNFTSLRFRTPGMSPTDISLMIMSVAGDGSMSSMFTGMMSQMGSMMMGTPPPPNGIVPAAEAGPFIEGCKKAFTKKGYEWSNKHNMIGVRQDGGVDTFNDFVFLCINKAPGELDENWEVRKFTATTKPGKFVLENPNVYNKKGTGAAILVPGQYKTTYKVGVHGRRVDKKTGKVTSTGHPALKQTGGSVDLYRDNNKDSKHDYVSIIKNRYAGINIHRAGSGVTTRVGKYSAGCQVFSSAKDHEVFIGLLKAIGEKYYTYTLLINEDL